MATVDELNATWDQKLDGLNAGLWARLQLEGVTARWVDPLNGRPSNFTESVDDGPYREVPAQAFFEFVVSRRGQELVSGRLGRADPHSHALTLIIRAAQMLTEQGVRGLL